MSSLLKIPVSLLFFLASLTASGGDPYFRSAGACEAGKGFACVMKEGFWSSFHNQALLALNNSFTVGADYENRFGISQLGTATFALAAPAGKTSLGVILSHFGYAEFKRIMSAAACGMKLSQNLYSGIQIDFLSERSAGEYIRNSSLTFEAGFLYRLPGGSTLGIHIFNPLPDKLRKRDMPSSIRAGAGTWLNDLLYAAAEAEIRSGKPLAVRTGFEYRAMDKLWLRGGFSTESHTFSFGFGYLAKLTKLDLAFLTHEKLGISTQVSVTYVFEHK